MGGFSQGDPMTAPPPMTPMRPKTPRLLYEIDAPITRAASSNTSDGADHLAGITIFPQGACQTRRHPAEGRYKTATAASR